MIDKDKIIRVQQEEITMLSGLIRAQTGHIQRLQELILSGVTRDQYEDVVYLSDVQASGEYRQGAELFTRQS